VKQKPNISDRMIVSFLRSLDPDLHSLFPDPRWHFRVEPDSQITDADLRHWLQYKTIRFLISTHLLSSNINIFITSLLILCWHSARWRSFLCLNLPDTLQMFCCFDQQFNFTVDSFYTILFFVKKTLRCSNGQVWKKNLRIFVEICVSWC
jgi:hypothetical protein